MAGKKKINTENPEAPAITEDDQAVVSKFAETPEPLLETSFKPYKAGSKEARLLISMFQDGITLDEMFEWYSREGWIKGQNKSNLNQYFSNIRKRLEGTGFNVVTKDGGRKFVEKIAN